VKYAIIYADPPWLYEDNANESREWMQSREVDNHYATLEAEELIALPVYRIAEPNSMLFMWCTWPKLDVGMECIRSWGFKYVTCVMDWVKTCKNGKPKHTNGFWTMGGSEFLLLGRRGKGLPRRDDTRGLIKQVHFAPATKHSRKPQEGRERICRLLGRAHTRIELFARERAAGWAATGLDLDGVDIRDFLGRDEVREEDLQTYKAMWERLMDD